VHRAWKCVLIVGALVLGGCGGRARDTRNGTSPGAAATGGGLSEDPLDGRAIGSRDSLMRTLREPLQQWVGLWKAARPEFELDSLRFARWEDFRPAADEQPWQVPDSLESSEEGLNALVVVAPGGRRRLLIDRYQVISRGAIGGDPDAAPVLADLGTGRTFTFESCGTSCGFHWAAWIDSVRFVLGGWEESREDPARTSGTLTYYDLRRGLQATYLVPLYRPEEYERYRSAWEDWVLARLRRLGSRPRA
jgi:hypothetical protein